MTLLILSVETVTFFGPVDIAARDFEAFIRVMPHPEFPSGSSCLCTTYQEFTDMWMTDRPVSVQPTKNS